MKNVIYLLFLIIVLSSCESEYSKLVKSELKSGVVYEELFLGLKIGETKKQFYDKCWELNKQKLVNQGTGNKYAKYLLDISTEQDTADKVITLFYGIFDEDDVMYGMEFKMSSESWSPWNKHYQSDALIERLKKYYMREYDNNPFISIQANENETFAKIDGNRQILIYKLTDKDVSVKITDIRSRYDIK